MNPSDQDNEASLRQTATQTALNTPPTPTTPAPGPLSGIRVVDMTAVGMGPYCTQTLGDYGADVIKVESPDGDVFRYATPSKNHGMGAPFVQLNRNKRSVILNLKQAQHLQVLKDLARRADILVYNLRPQAMRALGLDYAALTTINPRLVYCGVYGFSEQGPYAGRPAFDDIIQASSGMADLQGRGDGSAPTYVTSILADKVTGLSAVNAILAALYERTRSGRGQSIEVPMFETMVSFNLMEHMAGATFGGQPRDMGYARALSVYRKPYKTLDGYIGLLPYTSQQWQRFFELAGCPEVLESPKFATPSERAKHIGELYAMLENITPSKTTAQWMALLEAADVPATPVNKLEDLLTDPHLLSTGMFETREHPTEGSITMTRPPAGFSRTPAKIDRLAPGHGEHNDEIFDVHTGEIHIWKDITSEN